MNHAFGYDPALSTYVQSRVANLGGVGHAALDLACGSGRHSTFLARHGYQVVAADLDMRRLVSFEGQTEIERGSVSRVKVDASGYLPFRDGSFDIVIVVHFVTPGLIANVAPLLRSRGHLLIETYGGHGENWRALPAPGQYREELSAAFEVVDYNERLVGPTKTEAASVRLLASRR